MSPYREGRDPCRECARRAAEEPEPKEYAPGLYFITSDGTRIPVAPGAGFDPRDEEIARLREQLRGPCQCCNFTWNGTEWACACGRTKVPPSRITP